MTTIHQVAKKAGVSSTTVSHVINQTRPVSKDMRQRVLAAMNELGYRPNALARSLRRGKTNTIGLIVPDSANPFFAEIGRAVENEAFLFGYNLFLCNSEEDQDKETLYARVLREKQVDGFILIAAGASLEAVSSLLVQGQAVVALDRELPGVEVDTVVADNYQGGYQATQHLIGLGHKRIACVTGPDFLSSSQERLAGYRAAIEQAGIPFDATLVVSGDFHPDTAEAVTRQLLSIEDPPSAIFACNDMMAVGIISQAQATGCKIPQNLSVVGFDDIALASYTTPALTTISQPKHESGQRAFQLLKERMTNEDLPRRYERLPVQLVVRGSSGPLG